MTTIIPLARVPVIHSAVLKKRNMPTAISVDDVHKHYGSLHALRGVSLQVEQGEFLGLLGPNGAGKSTLIGILAGLIRPQAGRARILGHDVVNDYVLARRNLGVVPQELVFDPFFTVREVLRIQAGYYGLGRGADAWIDELLDALDLTDKAEKNMRSLSGGMKRRVLVAQALVHKPPVVVLDEPTAGVDVALRKLLWQFVQRLHREGHTIVLTTHYLEEAEELCSRIAILNHGQIIALDSTASMLEREAGATRRLHVTLDKAVSVLPPVLEARIEQRNEQQLVFRLDRQQTVADILDGLGASGARIVDVHTEERDLEDIFVALTSQRKPA